MDEKRKYVRLNAHLLVEWKKIVDPAHPSGSKDNDTQNISEGGICLNVYEKVQVGDLLDLAIKLPDQKIIHSKSRVQWVRESDVVTKRYDVGLEFLDISPRDREEIKGLVLKSLSR